MLDRYDVKSRNSAELVVESRTEDGKYVRYEDVMYLEGKVATLKALCEYYERELSCLLTGFNASILNNKGSSPPFEVRRGLRWSRWHCVDFTR